MKFESWILLVKSLKKLSLGIKSLQLSQLFLNLLYFQNEIFDFHCCALFQQILHLFENLCWELCFFDFIKVAFLSLDEFLEVVSCLFALFQFSFLLFFHGFKKSVNLIWNVQHLLLA